VPIVIVHYVASLLTIEVSGTELRWYFGLGLWRKRVSLTEIASLARVHLPWWYGIGVKYTPAVDLSGRARAKASKSR